jgi:hypothetical protein
VAEWVTCVGLSDGTVWIIPADSQPEAEAQGRRLRGGVAWWVESRLVSEWQLVGPARRMVEETVKDWKRPERPTKPHRRPVRIDPEGE